MAARFFNWKVILLFCLGIICALIFIDMFIPSDPDIPTLPGELLLQSQAMRQNAEMEPRWQTRLRNRHNDNGGLVEVANEALVEGAYSAALTAATLVKDKQQADKLLTAIIMKGSSDCESLPWAAAALADLSEKPASIVTGIHQKWQECRRAK